MKRVMIVLEFASEASAQQYVDTRAPGTEYQISRSAVSGKWVLEYMSWR